MIEKPAEQLRQFEEHLNTTLGKVVALYAVRFTYMVIVITIAATVWAAKMQFDLGLIRASLVETKADLKDLKTSQENASVISTARLIDWSQWRAQKDVIDAAYERRLAWLETLEKSKQP